MKKKLTLLLLIIAACAYSQQKKMAITWGQEKTLATDSYSIKVPSFGPSEHYTYTLDKGLLFYAQWEITNLVNEPSISLSSVQYDNISVGELKDLDKKTIPNSLVYSLKNAVSREKKYAVFSLSPIIKMNGAYKKVTSFTINYTNSTLQSNKSSNQALSSSALKSGDWYKFSVDKSGVYRISRSFLNSLGVNVNNVDPRNIKLYGNGGQMIPYSNAVDYPIDIAENAIRFVGEGDGSLDDQDFILFYAQGPEGIVDNPIINTNLNPYVDKTYYYINVSSGFGKRIGDLVQPSGNPDLVINQFHDYQFHEVDDFSIALVGRRWFGDRFDVESTKTFDFDFPNLVTNEPISFKTIAATASPETSNLNININGSDVSVLPIPGATDPNLATEAIYQDNVMVSNSSIAVTLTHDNLGNPSSLAYIDYISIEAIRDLAFAGDQMIFRNKNTVSNTIGIAEYQVTNTSNVSEIWDITDLYNVTSLINTNGENTVTFNSPIAGVGSLRSFVAVTPTDYYEPSIDGNPSISNQDIKGTIFLNEQGDFQDVDYIIVSPRNLISQANRLAQINKNIYGLNVKVLALSDIYQEFSSGNQDVGAIRNMVKYVYDNASVPENRLKYLCLFGDSSFDYKDRIPNNTNIVPSWHAYESFNLTSSFVSDDFYGMMDETEGEMSVTDRLDIAVGRILALSPQSAKELVDKVESYYQVEAYGSWRNNFLVISDDVDLSWEKVIQETTDQIGNTVADEKSFLNVIKIHSDAFQQEASAGGDRYPDVTEEISNVIENGVLVVNYFGHGGEDGLAFERIYQKPEAQNLRNVCKLNCFVTVTCEYTRFDNPLRETAGELIYWNTSGGAISLITTTRAVFVSVGITFNQILEEYLFSFNDTDDFDDNEYPSMAEALRLTKNDPNIASISQRRLVFYIGDPAMKLAIPKPNIRLTKVNDVPITDNIDTLSALSLVKLSGEVTDLSGNVLNNFNGILSTTLYDKEIQRETLANDNVSDGGQLIVLDFKTLGEIVFRGQASITNGQFEFEFVVPRDITIPEGFGRVSFYAKSENSEEDFSGASINTVRIGGINENAAADDIGPNINMYMNDENFVSGGITNESPTLLVKLQDDNGINTASGIGHDIVAILDGDETNPYVLNDYYQTEIDDYKRGEVVFPLRDIEPGIHTLSIKAWDVYNNSGTAELQFVVYNENDELIITNVLNYPNPFVNYTEFWFNHNSSESLDVSVQIFTVTGKIVRTLNGQTQNGIKITSSVSRDIVWDGRDDFGDKIGKGVYIYKLKVHSKATNKTVEKIEKLVIL